MGVSVTLALMLATAFLILLTLEAFVFRRNRDVNQDHDDDVMLPPI